MAGRSDAAAGVAGVVAIMAVAVTIVDGLAVGLVVGLVGRTARKRNMGS